MDGINTESRIARYEVKLKEQLGSQPIQKIDPGGGIHVEGDGHGNGHLQTNQENKDPFDNNTLQLLDYLSSLIINSNSTPETNGPYALASIPSSIYSVRQRNNPARKTTVTPSFYQPTSTIISMSPDPIKGGKHVISYSTNPGNEDQISFFVNFFNHYSFRFFVKKSGTTRKY